MMLDEGCSTMPKFDPTFTLHVLDHFLMTLYDVRLGGCSNCAKFTFDTTINQHIFGFVGTILYDVRRGLFNNANI